MILILQTRGKGDSVDSVCVKIFSEDDPAAVEAYLEQNSDNGEYHQYWMHAEVIEEGATYDVARGATQKRKSPPTDWPDL